MTFFHGVELEWIATLQSLADAKRVLKVCSGVAHSSIPYLMPLVYLGLSRSLGAQLYLLAALNSCVVWMLKSGFHWPRPYWLDGRIQAMEKAGYYGMPSGHVQGATVFWGFLAWAVRKWWAWCIAGVLIGLVALARIYLGVHFISDTLGGLLVGGALVAVFVWAMRTLREPWSRLVLWQQLAAVVLVAGGIVFIGLLPALVVPSAEYDPDAPRFALRWEVVRSLMGPAGTFFGTGCALVLAQRWARFDASGPLWERGVRVVFALAGMELVRWFFSAVPTPDWKVLRGLLLAGKAVAIPFWILLAAPFILMRAEFLRAAVDPAGHEPRGLTAAGREQDRAEHRDCPS